MTKKYYRFFFEMLEQPCQIREKVFVLITAARAGPLAVAVAAQVERYGMLNRHAPRYQRFEKVIPAPPLVAHAVNENVSLFIGIAPLPEVKLQTIMNKITLPRFQIHKLLVTSLQLPPSLLF